MKIFNLQSSIFKPSTLFLLFLLSFFLVQGFALFGDAIRLPVFANQPPGITLIQSSQSPKILMEQGKALYEAGQFSEAAKVLQQAAAAFKTQGDGLREAMTLSNLSLVYQQMGLWSEAKDAITESLKLLQSGGKIRNSRGTLEQTSFGGAGLTQILAQTLDIQGRLQLSLGQPEQALNTWQQATAIYTQIGNQDGINQSQINQAQALQNLGLYPRACKTLLKTLGIDNQDCKLSQEQLQTLKNTPASHLKALGLRSLGDILQLVGDLKQSENILRQSLDIAQRLQSPPDISAAYFSLGNTLRAQAHDTTDSTRNVAEDALTQYQQAADESTSPTTKLQAQLNQLSLQLETKKFPQAQDLWPQIKSQLAKLPPTQTAVYARINLAESLMKLSPTEMNEAAQQLAIAIQQAKSLDDKRATAYALGNLGRLYEQTNQLSNAQDLTNKALLAAQTINASDIAYRWQWQLGRLLRAQGNRQGAIAAYTSAVSTLKDLRSDLVSINPDVQFSFRDSVEPVYRELVGLLLESQGSEPNSDNLAQARDVIESLQQAELINFFREDCLNAIPIKIDQVDRKAVVIYPIVLKDRLEVVLALPNSPLRHYATPLPQAAVEDIFTQLRNIIAGNGSGSPNRNSLAAEVRPGSSDPSLNYLPLSQKIYDWLIRPAEQDIATSQAKTLVFVLDGPLLNLPMAVLHDGKQFLIEKYAIAYTPGLQLLDPKPLLRGKLSALKAGLTEARQDFPALPFVEQELNQIQSQVPGELLLNQKFTKIAIQKEIDSVPFPVVHLATHGQFSSNEEETFILTWDDRLNVNQLNNLLRTRGETNRGAIELLVLSACQTAAGDKRAALGLAGVAVKAGARSTLATLWSVSDAATAELMTRFYRELRDTTITKAEALRRAQVALLRDSHYQPPFYWAPYVLVGNWL